MTTMKYIEGVIENFFLKFREPYQIVYQFDRLSNTHFFLLPNSIYDNPDFADFDFQVTTRAYEHNIQGQICFTTDALLFDDPKTYFNQFNNEAVLGNLNHFIDIRGVQLDFGSFENNFPGTIIADPIPYDGFDNLALAA